jgi:hypothetical protein
MTDKEKEAPLRLLQLLGVLPNGIAREELNAILPPDRGYAAETILLGAALAFENKNRLLLRAPLQRFVARAHPPGLDDQYCSARILRQGIGMIFARCLHAYP